MRFIYKLLTWDHKVARRPILKGKTSAVFLSNAPLFVPSLSWQTTVSFLLFLFETGETCTKKRPVAQVVQKTGSFEVFFVSPLPSPAPRGSSSGRARRKGSLRQTCA